MRSDTLDVVCFYTLLSIAVIGFPLLTFVGCPHYNAWERGVTARKLLQDEKIKNEAAKLRAETEDIKAESIVKSSKKINEAISKNDKYLEYLVINKLLNSDNKKSPIFIIPYILGK